MGRLGGVLERLGASWSRLGTSWGVLGRLGAVLGASWTHLGAVCGALLGSDPPTTLRAEPPGMKRLGQIPSSSIHSFMYILACCNIFVSSELVH